MSDLLTPQQLHIVASCFLFQGVDEILVEQLTHDPMCRKEAYDRGAVIFDETHFTQSLGVVLSGQVLVEKNTADGKRLSMSRLGQGDCFGAAAMFHSRRRYASVLTAKKPTEVFFLHQNVITWAMRRNAAITENYIAYLSDRIWFLSSRITALTAGSARKKLSVYLLEQGRLDSSMTELCQQLNLGRASLYRAVEELEEAGAIVRDGRSLRIRDEALLRKMLGK